MPDEQNISKQSPQSERIITKNTLGIPIAIVLAAALIAGAIIYTGSIKQTNPIQVGNERKVAQETAEIEIVPVSEKDHILGNPNAPIMIVEYSDYDCPFCKNFHETMQKIIGDYGEVGKVAWVYRHFPLVKLHQNAPKIAASAECVTELGGNDAFWKFSNLIFQMRGTNEPTNINNFAEQAGVDKIKFTECSDSGRYNKRVDESINEALKTGAEGTPYSIILVGDQKGVINGAQSYETVKQVIETILEQIEVAK